MSLRFFMSHKGQITISFNITTQHTHGNLMNGLAFMLKCLSFISKPNLHSLLFQTNSSVKHTCLISMQKSIFKPPVNAIPQKWSSSINFLQRSYFNT